MILVFYILSAVKLCDINIFKENATIFTVSMAAPYMCWLSWSSLASQPNEVCNPFTESVGNTVA